MGKSRKTRWKQRVADQRSAPQAEQFRRQERKRRLTGEPLQLINGTIEPIKPSDVLTPADATKVVQRKLGVTEQHARRVRNTWDFWAYDTRTYTLANSAYNAAAIHKDEAEESRAKASRANGAKGGRPKKPT
jgi:hypothetical protein